MNELTTEDQRLLTEFLGECWHTDTRPHYPNGMCTCGRKKIDCEGNLDFFDWRVVGRLIEKLESIEVWKSEDHRGSWGAFTDGLVENVYTQTPQLAICHAVLAYLKEQKDVL